MNSSVYVKAVAVIESCTTEEQLNVAEKYLELAFKNNYMTLEDNDQLWFDAWLPKSLTIL